MATQYSYDSIYKVYAFRDNRHRLVLTQGEGLTDSGTTSNTSVKAPRFQLRDERGVITLPNSSTAVKLAITFPDGTEGLFACNVEDTTNGIISCPIMTGMTSMAGDLEGEIRFNSTNAIIKFYGVNFHVYEGVSNDAIALSSKFSYFDTALSKLDTLSQTASGQLATLDDLATLVAGGGTHPSTSKTIYDFVDGNYMRRVSIHDAEVDTANDSHTLYIHTTDNYRRGLVIFVDLKVYNGGITVRQYRLLNNGRLEYRLGTVNANTSSNNTYVWDKAYNEDWHPLGTTNNIENLAVTTAKLAEGAVTSAKIGTGEVKTTNIENLAVTEGKIADLNITEGKIYNGAVTENKIGNGAVTTDKLGTGAVTSVKLATDSVSTDKIEGLAVTTAKIRDGAVNEDKLAANAVTTDKIKNSEVTPAKLDRTYTEYTSILYSSELDEATRHGVIYRVIVGGAIATVFCTYNGSGLRTQYAFDVNGRAKYRTQAVAGGEWQTWSDWYPIGTTQNIDDSAVTTAKINDLAVTTDKLKDNAVKTGKINDGAVTQSKLAGNSVGTNELINGSVTTAKINSGAITTGKLDGKAVTTAKLDDDAVTNDKLADDAVDTAQIKNLAVTGAKIANGAVDTAHLAYAAVTNDNIDSNAVDTEEINDGAVTTAKIANSAITTSKIADDSVTAAKLAESYALQSTTIAGINLESNIGANALASALSSALVNREGLINYNQDIVIGTADKQSTTSEGNVKNHNIGDYYINKYNGKIWKCSDARSPEVTNSVWQYSWGLVGNIFNYPLKVSLIIYSNTWTSNHTQNLTNALNSVAEGRTKVDVSFDNTVYNQLVADGCAGLYVATDTSGQSPTYTLYAMGNNPTDDITIQLTLSNIVTA